MAASLAGQRPLLCYVTRSRLISSRTVVERPSNRSRMVDVTNARELGLYGKSN